MYKKVIYLEKIKSEHIYGCEDREDSYTFSEHIEVFASIDSSGCISFIPHTGSNRLGKTFGRFSGYFNKKDYCMDNSEKYIELVEFPNDNTTINVSNTNHRHSRVLNLGTLNSNKNISEVVLDDIFVTVETINGSSRLVLLDTTGEKLHFTSSTMLNPKSDGIYTKISQFLLYVSNLYTLNPLITNRLLEDFCDIPYVPQLRYKNVVVCEAKWILDNKLLNDDKLNVWREKWNVPRYLLYSNADESLMIDLDSPDDLKYLKKKNQSYFILTEFVFRNFEKSKKYTEYVFNLSMKSEKESNIASSIVSKKNAKLSNSLSNLKWIYVILVGVQSSLLELITRYLLPFFEEKYKSQQIQKFYYVIYNDDSKKSLRIRLLREDTSVDDTIFNFFYHLLEKEYCFDIIQKIYFPEIDRYGGNRLISDVETIFTCDSYACGKYLMNVTKTSEREFLINTAHTVFSMLKALDVNINYFGKIVQNKYRKVLYRDKLRQLFPNNTLIISNFSLYFAIGEDFSKKYENFYYDFLRYLDKSINIKVTMDRSDLLLSLVHMHFNRLNIDNTTEKHVMIFILYIYEIIDAYEKRKNKGIIKSILERFLDTIHASDDIVDEVQKMTFKESPIALSEYPSIVCFLIFILNSKMLDRERYHSVVNLLEKYLRILIGELNSIKTCDISLCYGFLGVLRILSYGEQTVISLRKMREQLEHYFLKCCREKLEFCVENKDYIFEEDYDILQGISGLSLYFLDKNEPLNLEADNFLKESLKYLEDILMGEEEIHLIITKDSMINEKLKVRYPMGYLNLGLSHGILGPVLVLARAYKLYGNFRYLKILNLVSDLYKRTMCMTNDLVYWPQRVGTIYEDVIDNIMPNSSWCYGTSGIAKSLFEVSQIIKDKELYDIAMKALKSVVYFPMDDKLKNSNAICHGNAGLALVMIRMYEETHDEYWKLNAQIICSRILESRTNDNYIFWERDSYCKGRIFSTPIDYVDLGLLTGTTGILMTLIASETIDTTCLRKLFAI